jgi:hypothetical protein
LPACGSLEGSKAVVAVASPIPISRGGEEVQGG